MAKRSLTGTIGKLALALLNATLLLVVLCLWFAWSAMSAAERASVQIRQAAEAVTPLREDVTALTAELAAARADIAALSGDAASLIALQGQLARLEAGVNALAESAAGFEPDRDAMIDRAIRSAFALFGGVVADQAAALR